MLWDSKTTNKKGNFNQFLHEIFKLYKTEFHKRQAQNLSDHRKLPLEAFYRKEIGYFNGQYLIPVRNQNKTIIDIRRYKLGERVMSTPGVQNGLYRLEQIKRSNNIFICEGEFDCLALQWLLQTTKTDGIVVAVPGVSTFKDDWVPCFKNKNVVVCYDKDTAGEDGEHRVLEKIGNTVNSIKFLSWLEKFPKGYDINDFVSLEAVRNKRPKRCLKLLKSMFSPSPRRAYTGEVKSSTSEEDKKPDVDKTMNWEKLEKIVKKWLKVDDLNHFKVGIGIIISNHVQGDPLWVQFVASPGEGKSELLSSFKFCDEVFITSSISPNALISGAVGQKKEPSLLPKLDGKSLIVKDGSTIQGMREADRESLFGALRDAYDGEAGKVYGTGQIKKFKSRFSMMWGVTPSIYQLDEQMSALGERFIKYFIGNYLDHEDQFSVIMRAMSNVGREKEMRTEIASAVYSYIENLKEIVLSENFNIPNVSDELMYKIGHLAIWCSKIKGTITRDKHERHIMLSKAYAEVGTRTAKQFKQISTLIPTALESGEVGELEYSITKKIALDTVSAKREDVFRCVYMGTKKDKYSSITIEKLVEQTKYSYSTISRVLDDLIALKTVNKISQRKPFRYQVNPNFKLITERSGLYEDKYAQNRKTRSNEFIISEKRKLISARRRKSKVS